MSKNQVLKFIPIEVEKDFDVVLRQISVSSLLEDMLNRNASGDKEGVSLLKIMRNNGFSTDLYWTSPIFDEYKKLLDDIKNSHEKFREL